MKVSIKVENNMEKGNLFLQIEEFMKGNLKMIILMDMVNLIGQMVKDILENGKQDYKMEMVNIYL